MTRNALGKGEVVSSILTGSTEYARQIEAFRKSPDPKSATIGRTEREEDAMTRGKSGDSVRALSRDLRAKFSDASLEIRSAADVLAASLGALDKSPDDARVRRQVIKNYAAWLKARSESTE